MGGGSWTECSFKSYADSRGMSVKDGVMDVSDKTVQEVYAKRRLDASLRITGDTIRECCDSEEHPRTVPVILALDVTGSMGHAAMEVAAKMNKVMSKLYETVRDVEFMIMAIGDLAYDEAPIQVSQFESDIRIAEHLDKVFFEGGGGSNPYESYTAAWYVGLHNTKLDCWKRGEKGLIITMGDEQINPYLPKAGLKVALGSDVQADVETKDLMAKVVDKYNLVHIHVVHGLHSGERTDAMKRSCDAIGLRYVVSSVDDISKHITELVQQHAGGTIATPVEAPKASVNDKGEIVW